MFNLKHRIIWLDDDLVSARTYAGVLDSNLCKIQFVLSTQELFRCLSEPWDLIILDLQLSAIGWEGLDFLLDYRRSNRATPILVCTGMGSKREVKKAFELGADALVFKEDIAEELVIAVDKLLDPSLRFNGIVEQFPTPIAYLGRRFIEASSELEQLRVAFDLFEMATKLIMIYCLADVDDKSSWRHDLRTHLDRKILLVPTLGDWVQGLGLIGRAESDNLCEISNKLRSTLRTEKMINVLGDAVRARNLVTHGVTPPASVCKEYVQVWWPVFFKFLTRCTPLHTHQMIVVDSLERNPDGVTAKIRRVIGSSTLLRRDQLRCDTPPFTGQVILECPDSKSLITLHPWIRVSSATVSGNAIRIYDKTVASSRVEGQRVSRPSDLVEFVDLMSGEKLRLGEVSDFRSCRA